ITLKYISPFSGPECLFGYRADYGSVNKYAVWVDSTKTYAFNFGSVDTSYVFPSAIATDKSKITLSRDGFFYNDTLLRANGNTTVFENTKSALIFAMNTVDSIDNRNVRMQVFNSKIWQDGLTLKQNLIPAKRNSDGAIGMYDTVTDKFYGNSGSGSFVAGPVSSNYLTCSACPTAYPNSSAGSQAITSCYTTRTASCTKNNATTPSGCASVTAYNDCSCDGSTYIQYSNTSGNGDGSTSGTTSESCTKTVKTVTAGSGYYVDGATCPVCPTDYPNSSDGNSGGAAACYTNCGAGTYVSTANAACTNVGIGYYKDAHSVNYGSVSERNQCPAGLTTIGYGTGADEAGDCGRKLHLGDNVLYLRTTQKTTPSLKVDTDNDGTPNLFGNMSTTSHKMSDGVTKSYKSTYNGSTYYIYDDSARLSCPAGQYDIGFSQCIDPSTNGTDNGSWDFTGDTENIGAYSLAEPGTWGVTFRYGKIKGIASCNSTPGTGATPTNENFSQTSTGRYCWCKMTEPVGSKWVFFTDAVAQGYPCDYVCAWGCAHYGQTYSSLREGLFGSVGL
ncbi:MAG: hypothetical protein KBS86_02280, partial [Proteobacteria bacterium]|nr:hypothetical protein [Candidatus Enterousia scatequi]